MAKTKKKTESISSLDEKFAQQFGDGVIVTGNYIVNEPQVVVPISPMIDAMLGGGIPFGSFVIPTGAPKVGKTSMALQMAANALDIPTTWDNPRRLHFFNIEGRLNKRDLLGIHNMKKHLEDGRVQIYTSSPGKILTAENYLEMGEAYINEEPGSIFIFDSFSQLCSKKGREKMKGLHKRTFSGWEPVDDNANKILRRYKFGEVAELENTIKRNSKFNAKYFVMLKLTFDNQDFADNMEMFRKLVQIQAGHYYWVTLIDGTKQKESKKIRFEKMDDLEFENVYNDVFNVCLKILGLKSEELEMELLKFA